MTSLSELIRQAQNGDADAIESLVVRFSDAIRQECARFSLNQLPDLSQADLYQEVLLRVWTKIGQFQGGVDQAYLAASFESWIRKSARSTLHNLHRGRSTRKRAPENPVLPFDEVAFVHRNQHSEEPGVSSILAEDEEAQRLGDAMRRCLDNRAVLILNRYFVDGSSFSEIAKELSLTYDQVRYAFQKALTELKTRLDSNNNNNT